MDTNAENQKQDGNHESRNHDASKKHSSNDGSLDYGALRDLEMRWLEIEESYLRRYPNLSEEDLQYREGEFNELIERIAQRTNRNRKEVNDEIWEWDSDDFNASNLRI